MLAIRNSMHQRTGKMMALVYLFNAGCRPYRNYVCVMCAHIYACVNANICPPGIQ